MILSICSDPKVLEIMRIVNLVINVIRIAVPIILIFVLMIKLVGAVTKSDEDGLKKVLKTAPKNILAAALVFLVPMIVRIVVHITAPDSEYEKCITITSVSEVNNSYEQRMEQLVLKAEETKTLNDYNAAYNYLKYIKDADKRKEYEERLEKIKNEIDNSNSSNGNNNSNNSNGEKYSNVNYQNFKWTYYGVQKGPNVEYYSKTSSYAIWAPENVSDLNGESLPLIIWLHGLGSIVGDVGKTGFLQKDLILVVKQWSKYNLKPISAIIVAPQCYGAWNEERNRETIRALVKYTKAHYNIDTNRIVLMGHSNGGYNVPKLLVSLKDLNFHAAVIMSAPALQTPKDKEYFNSIKLRGYGEVKDGKNFFEGLGKPNNFTYYPGVSHSGVIEKAFTEDLNNDGTSDLISWILED